MGYSLLTPGQKCSVLSEKVTFSNLMLDVSDIYETGLSLKSLEFYFLLDFGWEKLPRPHITLTDYVFCHQH